MSIIMNAMKWPVWSSMNFSNLKKCFLGMKNARIDAPSSGLNGRRLKRQSTTLIIIKYPRKLLKNVAIGLLIERRIWYGRATINAVSKLERGPAAATIALSRIGFLKLFGFTGTGFPQPIFAIKIINVPSGSKCLSGFKLTLPCIFAVGSPSLNAVQACAHS